MVFVLNSSGLTCNVRKMFMEMDQGLFDECLRQFDVRTLNLSCISVQGLNSSASHGKLGHPGLPLLTPGDNCPTPTFCLYYPTIIPRCCPHKLGQFLWRGPSP
eukprot:692655-Pyramimonas_sp.AAC.1